MNDLRALVDDATPEGTPGFDAVLARRDQRSRRRRGVAAGAAATTVLVTGLVLHSMNGVDDAVPPPAPTPPSESPTTIDRADPTYTYSDERSPLLVRTPARDVPLEVWLGCWEGPTGDLDCTEEEPTPTVELPDVGAPQSVDFWFGVDGWEFVATFTQVGVDCPRSERTSVSKDGHWFHLVPAGFAGDYRVDLDGNGPHGEFKGVPTKASFRWHTPVDGPVDQPKTQLSDSELIVSDLGFQPASATAEVTITDANGEKTRRQLPPFGSNQCPGSADATTDVLGGLFFQGDFDDPAIPELGPGPYSYRVRLTLDGTPYVGTAENDGQVTWTPSLPAYTR